MSEDLKQPKDRRVSNLFEKIQRLKAGEASVAEKARDAQYLNEQIERLKAEDPSLTSELDDLVLELGMIDPSFSTRSPGRGRDAINWNVVDRDALQVLGILDAESKKSARITEEVAQAVVNEKGLGNGVYTLRNTAGEVYIIVRDGKVYSQIFEPPTYDIGYLMRGSRDLKYGGVIQL